MLSALFQNASGGASCSNMFSGTFAPITELVHQIRPDQGLIVPALWGNVKTDVTNKSIKYLINYVN